MTKPIALVTGATGQDGWYLTRLLIARGYDVHAQSRSDINSDSRSDAISYHVGDLIDDGFLEALISKVRPQEIYNLAAMSRPGLSWQAWSDVAQINAFFPHRLCELIRRSAPQARLFQASSSEIFGARRPPVQCETTPCFPDNPYGISKEYAHRIVGAYRDRYGLHFSCGILFNHESPRRPLGFVSQKIVHGVALLALGRSESEECDEGGLPILKDGKISLGNIDTQRDFGFAGDYVKAMADIVCQPEPSDYVIGTGETHSIAEFCKAAFGAVGLSWEDHIVTRPDLVRPSDQNSCADPSKILAEVGWKANTSISELAKMMVEARIALLQQRLK